MRGYGSEGGIHIPVFVGLLPAVGEIGEKKVPYTPFPSLINPILPILDKGSM
jgi:hypothetical protein